MEEPNAALNAGLPAVIYRNDAPTVLPYLSRDLMTPPKRRSPRHLIYSQVLLLVTVFACWGDTVAVSPVGGTATRSDPEPYMLGWEFSVSAPVTISALAYLDATGGGLSESHKVGIFDAATGNVLISATVPAGPATAMLNGYRTVPVSLSLPAGTYVIGGQRLTDADGAFLLCSNVAAMPGVTYIEERELMTSSFSMPTTHAPAALVGVFGPSFVVASGQPAPAITGITNSASYKPPFSPLTYTTIYGTNLAKTTRSWLPSDFAGGTQLPVSLDGVSVTVDGMPAYVEYISSTQINIITPATSTTGKGVPLTVSIPGQPDLTSWIGMQALEPSLFTWITGTSDSGLYAVAQHIDYTNVGKPNLFPAASATFTTPAVPGETIILYGTGFGPTNPAIATGILTDKVYNLNPLPTATLGGLTAQVQFAGLIPPLADVYQLNVTIPPTIGNGDWPLVINVNGSLSYSALITVQH